MEIDIEKDIKTKGFFSQIVQRIASLEEFVRKHQAIQHGGSSGGSSAGWVADANTWTFSSADAPIYVVSVNADVTAVISVGMRIRLVHGAATKYFLVHAVGAFSGGVTLLTLYGGTTYTLSATAITVPYYSASKIPFGFPASPDSWSVTTTDTTNATQAPPVTLTWYNLGGITVVAPIGVWRMNYTVEMEEIVTTVAVGIRSLRATLSTANNTQSDSALTSQFMVTSPVFVGATARIPFRKEKILTVAAKTTYYLNGLFQSAVAATSISFRGDTVATIIKLTSAYL